MTRSILIYCVLIHWSVLASCVSTIPVDLKSGQSLTPCQRTDRNLDVAFFSQRLRKALFDREWTIEKDNFSTPKVIRATVCKHPEYILCATVDFHVRDDGQVLAMLAAGMYFPPALDKRMGRWFFLLQKRYSEFTCLSE